MQTVDIALLVYVLNEIDKVIWFGTIAELQGVTDPSADPKLAQLHPSTLDEAEKYFNTYQIGECLKNVTHAKFFLKNEKSVAAIIVR